MATPFPPIPTLISSTIGWTILKYLKLDFQGAWEFAGGSFGYVPAGATGRTSDLYVLTQTLSGSLVTYRFVVKRGVEYPGGGFSAADIVQVPIEENIVFIPTRCSQRYDGDPTACGI